MTQIVLKNSIDNIQMGVLLGLFNSWNVKAEITDGKKLETDCKDNNSGLENIRAGLEEISLFQKGQLITTLAKDFLNEL